MGCVKRITADKFPKQGPWLGKRCDVCFHYNAKQTIGGVFVRDDREEPYVSIIRLDDGRHVLTTECQHDIPRPAAGGKEGT